MNKLYLFSHVDLNVEVCTFHSSVKIKNLNLSEQYSELVKRIMLLASRERCYWNKEMNGTSILK